MYTINDFAMLSPMKYYNNEAECPKRREMLDNKDKKYIGTEKHDGDWGMFIHYEKGRNLIRSRSISKVTGVYGDYTAKLPHLVEEMDKWPDATVALAEICWDEYGTNANTVGTILRCLPQKAVERQKEKKLSGLIFDMLMIDGVDLTAETYLYRLDQAYNMCDCNDFKWFKMTDIFSDDFEYNADRIIAAGGEGLVIQLMTNPYMPGTRTAWKTLKLKQSMESEEYLVIGTLPPNKLYEGGFAENWKYWLVETPEGPMYINRDYEESLYQAEKENAVPITKPYYYGWKNGITIMLPSGIECDVTSGLTDEDREWLATGKATEMIAKHEIYAEVKAMSINDKGKLRHGYLVRLRTASDGADEE